MPTLWVSAIIGVAHADLSAQRGHYHPAWSPDGTQIVYVGDDDGDFELYLIEVSGGRPRQLTFNDVLDAAPSFTPGGDSIVYSCAVGPDRDICIVPVAGGDPHPLIELPGHQGRPQFVGSDLVTMNDGMMTDDRSVVLLDRRTGEVRTLVDSPANDEWGTWSAAGDRMLVSTDRDGYWTIYVADWDGSRPTRLLDTPAGTVNNAPHFAPNGQSFVYQTNKTGDFEVFLYDLNERTEVNLSRSPSSYDGIPAFSPDGEWIAFESTREDDRRIFVMRVDGTGVRRVSGQAGSSR